MATNDSLPNYDFDNDPVFQQGLTGLLTNVRHKSSEEVEQLVNKAKAFYLAKKKNSLEHSTAPPTDVTHTTNPDPPASDADEVEVPQLSFAEISQLIQEGKAHLIPNNKVIPTQVNDSSPSEPQAILRLKPWEKQANQLS